MHSEEEQIQAIKNWWRENGVAVMLGVIVGLGGLFGWQAWQGHLNKQAEEASVLYSKIMVAMESDKGEGVAASADEIVQAYANTPYAVLAALAAAKVAISKNDLPAAKERFQWILDNGKQPEFTYIARLRLARLLLQQSDYSAVEELLSLEDYPESYGARLAELRGDLYAAQGDYAAARAAYDAAVISPFPARNQQMIEIKRDHVAGKVTADTSKIPDIEVQPAAAEPSDA